VEGGEFVLLLFLSLALFGGKAIRQLKMGTLILPFVLIYLPWLVFSQFHPSPNPVGNLPGVAVRQIMAGNIHFSAIVYTIKFILWRTIKSDRVWGLFIPVASFYMLFTFIFRKDFRSNLLIRLPLASGATCGLAVVLMYFITSYDKQSLEYWLGTGVDRMLIPAIIFLGLISGVIIALVLSEQWSAFCDRPRKRGRSQGSE